MDASTVIILISSGVLVGFINTLGAGATVISMVVYMAMGIPIMEAAGTNRVSVIIQNLTASLTYRSQNMLDTKESLKLAIPIIIGTLLGTQFALNVSEEIFTGLFIAGLIGMSIMLIASPSSWTKPIGSSYQSRVTPLHYIYLFIAGLYGGAVYVGLGYFLISVFVLGLGMDIVRANALKSFMAFTITPFSLLIFALNGEVNYTYGIVHALGNIVGSYIAARYAVKIGSKVIHKILLVLVILSILYATNVIKIG